MARIAIGGFQHETNTFSETLAGLADFERPDAWPGLVRGREIIDAVAGINLPIAGFIAAARLAGHQLVPLIWCSASPSGPVEEDAFEAISRMLLDAIGAAGALDAVYLDLHGAMVTTHLDDGEGEILSRIAAARPGLPIVASLDFHANVSDAMIEKASALLSYRTYPHIDMAETGARAAATVESLLADRRPLNRAFRRLPFLIPLTWQTTLSEPARGIFARLEEIEGEAGAGLETLSFAPGFPLADTPWTAPCVFAYGRDGGAVARAVESLAETILAHEGEFAGALLGPDEAAETAIRLVRQGRGPVILADTQDNPGAGGNGNGTGLLEALVRHRAEGALVGLMIDAEAARAAHKAGIGASIALEIGARDGFEGARPFAGRFTVAALGDGNFEATGPFYDGCHMHLGEMALLDLEGRGEIRIALASRKQQAADRAMFRHLGVDPAESAILALKSSVHFRADFGPLSEHILIVAAPGPSPADPARLPYRHLAPGIRRAPQRARSDDPAV